MEEKVPEQEVLLTTGINNENRREMEVVKGNTFQPPFPVFIYPNLPSPDEPAVLLVDKPATWTSFDVVNKLKRALKNKKVGHAGTLDPMATGLLICLVGRATKSMDLFMGLPKVYTGTFRLGETTASYDAETPVEESNSWEHITDEQIDKARSVFLGSILQTPPMYSAVKMEGERLYKKARRGEQIERPARLVFIYRFEITERHGQDVDFVVECSKGTYIRTLAHDLGHALGSGAHLFALRRTHIGPYNITNAWPLSELISASSGLRQ